MVQLRRDLRLFQKRAALVRIGGKLLAQRLDRHHPVQMLVFRGPEDTATARGKG